MKIAINKNEVTTRVHIIIIFFCQLIQENNRLIVIKYKTKNKVITGFFTISLNDFLIKLINIFPLKF